MDTPQAETEKGLSIAGGVTVAVPVLRGGATLARCLAAVGASSIRPEEILLVDNGSGQELGHLIPEDVPIRILRNRRNLGFASAMNQACDEASSEYVLVLNEDAFVEPRYMEECVAALVREPRAAGVSGKLLKEGLADVLDSTGHILWGDRRVGDRGEWETDHGQFDGEREVFGFPATAAVYRIDALHEARAVSGEIFDSSFFSYGEDVDLAWRLRLLGWKMLYEPKARASHIRSISGSRRPTAQLTWDLRNRHLYMVKNDTWPSILRHLGEISILEARLTFYFLWRRPVVPFRAAAGFFARLPRALRARRNIQRERKVADEEIERWFARYDYRAVFRRISRSAIAS